MDDQTAITRIKQGDWNGLESLVERYQARAVQAAYLVVFDQALAEDIVQTAFLKAAERINQYDETRAFGPWFYRIVVNDALKAARTQKHMVSVNYDEENGPATSILRSLATSEPLPELQIEQEELRQNILKAVRRLPPEQRAVITMHYFLNLSQADMSTRLNRPLTTIKWWLHDARKRLRSLLDGLR